MDALAAWFRAHDVQCGGVLRFRASRQYCTEAMSEVGCNSSPILLGKLLDITKLLCIECKFSDLGTIVILGRLECLILSNQRFSALGMNMHVKSLGRSMALPACSAAVVRGFPLSSYGLVSVPARNASLAGLCPAHQR